jgi:hypothetical protein
MVLTDETKPGRYDVFGADALRAIDVLLKAKLVSRQ